VEYQHSILWRGEDPVKRKFKPQFDDSHKVARYFPGKAPHWARKGEDGADEQEEKAEASSPLSRQGDREKNRRRGASAAAVEDVAASRLKRLAASSESMRESGQDRLLRHRSLAMVLESPEKKQEEEKKEGDTAVVVFEEERRRARNVTAAAVLEEGDKHAVKQMAKAMQEEVTGCEAKNEIKVKEEINPEMEDLQDELRARGRERARELALMKRKEEEEKLKVEKEELETEEDEDDEADESDYETDSEDDDPRRNAMLKPIFVSKTQRDTVKEKEALQREEEVALQKKEERKQERKAESKTWVVEEVRKDDEAEAAGLNDNDASDVELLDDDDEKNEAEEYELWKIRELKRIKRDREERLARQKELEWIEKRRGMTDKEREEDDKRLDASTSKREEAKQFTFMQKYYHRGGFFQDRAASGEEALYLRDYHEPTAEETYDKSNLPKAMQLRRGLFGKKGQVKHTHLTDVDTTDMSAAWSQRSKQVQKYQEKMAAAAGTEKFTRPSNLSRSSTG